MNKTERIGYRIHQNVILITFIGIPILLIIAMAFGAVVAFTLVLILFLFYITKAGRLAKPQNIKVSRKVPILKRRRKKKKVNKDADWENDFILSWWD